MNHRTPCPTFEIEFAQLSDLGMRRLNNQDALAVVVTKDVATWNTYGHLLMVADGMGAHAAGELASKLAVDNISHNYFKHRELYPPRALRQAIRDANDAIHAKGESSPGFHGMGTTCSCLVLLPQGALVAHIGDSRVYRLRGNKLGQLTFDHSLVWEMAAAGHIPEADVPSFIPKNVITRSLGPHPSVNIDLEGPFDVVAGDVFLICSDGLTGQVADEELGVLLGCLSPEEAVQTLVDVANLRGGPDNISIIVARVAGEAPPNVEQECSSQAKQAMPGQVYAPGLWGAVAVCLVALGFCLALDYTAGAIIAGASIAAALMLAVVARRKQRSLNSASRPIGGPYGNGPYREAECEPNRSVVNALAEIAKNLRQLPPDNGLTIDWEPLDAEAAQAAEAADKGDFAAAVRLYSHAIRQLMEQIRASSEPWIARPGSISGRRLRRAAGPALAPALLAENSPSLQGEQAQKDGQHGVVFPIAQPLAQPPVGEAECGQPARKESWHRTDVGVPLIAEELCQAPFFAKHADDIKCQERTEHEPDILGIVHDDAEANHHQEGTDIKRVADDPVWPGS